MFNKQFRQSYETQFLKILETDNVGESVGTDICVNCYLTSSKENKAKHMLSFILHKFHFRINNCIL